MTAVKHSWTKQALNKFWADLGAVRKVWSNPYGNCERPTSIWLADTTNTLSKFSLDFQQEKDFLNNALKINPSSSAPENHWALLLIDIRPLVRQKYSTFISDLNCYEQTSLARLL